MKLALIGNWGHHVHVLAETDTMADATVVGIARGYPGEDTSPLEQWYQSTAKTYDNHYEMLAAEQPDAVVVSTRLDLIAGLAMDAARAGCHVICEKPLALDQQTLLELWHTVQANGVQCIAMLPNRAHPVLAAAIRSVEAGEIGDIKLLNARKSYKFGNEREAWLGRRATYGGTLPWIGIHALDFIDAVTNSHVHSVSATHTNVAHPEYPECEDLCTMNLQLVSGALATASIDYLRPLTADGHGDDWIRIVGTRGIIEAGMDRGRCVLMNEDGQCDIDVTGTGQPYYVPLLRSLPATGQAATETTRRSFDLTHVALCARDAADNSGIITGLDAPWRTA